MSYDDNYTPALDAAAEAAAELELGRWSGDYLGLEGWSYDDQAQILTWAQITSGKVGLFDPEVIAAVAADYERELADDWICSQGEARLANFEW